MYRKESMVQSNIISVLYRFVSRIGGGIGLGVLCNTIILMSNLGWAEKKALVQKTPALFSNKKYNNFIDTFPKDWSSVETIDLVYLSEAYKRTNSPADRLKVLNELESRQKEDFRYPLQKAISYSIILDQKLNSEYINPNVFKENSQKTNSKTSRQPSSIQNVDLSKFKKAMPEEYEKALGQFEKAIKLGPKYRVTYHELLKFYDKHKNTHDAVALLNQMKDVYGNKDEYITGKLCVLYGERREVALTTKYCRQAIEINPKNPEPLVLLSLQDYDYSNDEEDFRKNLKKIKKKYPDFLKLDKLIGQSYLKEKKYNQAIGFLKNLENTRLQGDVYFPLAQAHIGINEIEKASQYFKKSCTVNIKPKEIFESIETASNKALISRMPAEANSLKKILRFCKKK